MLNRFNRLLRVLLIATTIMLVMCMTASAASISCFINANTSVYAAPTTGAPSVGVPQGFRVKVTAINGYWAQVQHSGKTAYIPLYYITLCNRMHGYISATTPAYQYATTSSRTAGPLPVNTDVYIVGREGDFWRIQDKSGKITCYVPLNTVSNKKVSVSAPSSDPRKQVVMLDWFKGGSDVVKKGETAIIYDIMSGRSFNVYRNGGSNHGDFEPCTAADTKVMYEICGGKFSWDSRPVILIKGSKYVACAINTQYHTNGNPLIPNNGYDGVFCLHMVNSKTHGTDKVNESHQAAIRAAYNWAHS
ncbi:MAG: hypothetical protein MJ099_01425 [Clostridia bacterium]|nr:hypothetical protein [Clostridia bacterium]